MFNRREIWNSWTETWLFLFFCLNLCVKCISQNESNKNTAVSSNEARNLKIIFIFITFMIMPIEQNCKKNLNKQRKTKQKKKETERKNRILFDHKSYEKWNQCSFSPTTCCFSRFSFFFLSCYLLLPNFSRKIPVHTNKTESNSWFFCLFFFFFSFCNAASHTSQRNSTLFSCYYFHLPVTKTLHHREVL